MKGISQSLETPDEDRGNRKPRKRMENILKHAPHQTIFVTATLARKSKSSLAATCASRWKN